MDPQATLRDLAQVAPDRTDYVTHSLAADEITNFLRTLVTEDRELVLEDRASTEDFRVLLQKGCLGRTSRGDSARERLQRPFVQEARSVRHSDRRSPASLHDARQRLTPAESSTMDSVSMSVSSNWSRSVPEVRNDRTLQAPEAAGSRTAKG